MKNWATTRLAVVKWSVMALSFLAVVGSFHSPATAQSAAPPNYILVFEGSDSPDGFEVGGSNVLNLDAALSAVTAAGGVVTADLTRQIGVVIASSANPLFADVLRRNPLVEAIDEDVPFKAVDDMGVRASGALPMESAAGEDPLEFAQWNMRDIRADQARARQAGDPAVDVAVLDSGIDAAHRDFYVGLESNIDVGRARSFVPDEPNPLEDRYGHGTLVSGLIGARKNGHGIVGVAPDVTIVPIKVFGAATLLRPSWAVQGITYAGDIRADVINMSFFVDDEAPGTSTMFKCNSDQEQRAYRKAVARAVRYARKRGALPVAAAGNLPVDLSAYPPEDPECDMIPAETPGVVAVSGLRPSRDGGTLTSYSTYGLGVIDVAAPAGEHRYSREDEACPINSGNVVSTAPGNRYECGMGTSLAAPHVSGVAALIISQYGTRSGGDVEMHPDAVEDVLLGSAIDVGSAGDDKCFGRGKVDALRAVLGDTSHQLEPTDCRPYPPPTAGNSCPGPQITDWAHAFDTSLENLDIVAAAFTDDGSGNLQITLTIRDLHVPPPPAIVRPVRDVPLPMASGGNWAVYLDYGGTRHIVQATAHSGSTATLACTAGPFNGPNENGNDPITLNESISCSFNEGPYGTIVFTVSLDKIGNPPPPAGAMLKNLTAGSYLTIGSASRSPRYDRAPNVGSGAEYTIGAMCIPPDQ